MSPASIRTLTAIVAISLPAHMTLAQNIQFETVNTGVACGTVSTPGVGNLTQNTLASDSLLSDELANTIATNHPLISSNTDCAAQVLALGTLDNLIFLTSDLARFGNAGQQLEDEFYSYLKSFEGQFGPSKRNIVNRYIGTESYSLFGGVLCDGATLCVGQTDCAGQSCPPGEEAIVVLGTANVDFYEVTASAEYMCNLP